MAKNIKLTLREKAILTWKRERPLKEAAKIEQQARYLKAVRRLLEQMVGTEYDIDIGVNDDGYIEATIQDLHFRTFIYNEEVITIIPTDYCSSCHKQISLGGVEDLAELGQALEEFKLGLRHQCN